MTAARHGMETTGLVRAIPAANARGANIPFADHPDPDTRNPRALQNPVNELFPQFIKRLFLGDFQEQVARENRIKPDVGFHDS